MDHQLEALKKEVFRKLAELSLEELLEVADKLSVNVPLDRQGKLSSTYRTVLQHLMSDDVQEVADEGLSVFQAVVTEMDLIWAARPAPDVKPSLTMGGNTGGAGGSGGPTVSSAAPSVPTSTPSTSQAGANTGATPTTNMHSTITNTSTINTHRTITNTPTTNTHSTVASGTPIMTTTTTSPLEQLATMLLQQMAGNVTSAGLQPTQVRTEVRRLTDFKINGVVGNGPGQLDYAALMYRIRDGKSKGYKPPEIISGVVAAMKPGSELRKLFESIPDITEEKFNQLLKGHYDIQSATNILTELTSCGQEPTQEVRDYVAKMIRLKNTLTVVAEEENFMNADMIYETFISAVNVGLRSTAIRLELQPILLKKLPDETLSYEVNKIVTREEKHRKMMGDKGLKASANVLDVDDYAGDTQMKSGAMSKDDIILKKLDSLSADMKVLATVKEDVQVLGSRMDSYDKRLDAIEKKVNLSPADDAEDKNNKYKNKKFIKCDNCEREKKWCTHCNNCGEGGHKRKDCPHPKK